MHSRVHMTQETWYLSANRSEGQARLSTLSLRDPLVG